MYIMYSYIMFAVKIVATRKTISKVVRLYNGRKLLYIRHRKFLTLNLIIYESTFVLLREIEFSEVLRYIYIVSHTLLFALYTSFFVKYIKNKKI